MTNNPEDTEYLLSLDAIEMRTRSIEFSPIMKKVYIACVEWRGNTLRHATSGQIAELAGVSMYDAQDTLKKLGKLCMLDYDEPRRKVRWTRSPTTYLAWLDKIRSY